MTSMKNVQFLHPSPFFCLSEWVEIGQEPSPPLDIETWATNHPRPHTHPLWYSCKGLYWKESEIDTMQGAVIYNPGQNISDKL